LIQQRQKLHNMGEIYLQITEFNQAE
jgi:hypothetical protein